MFFLLPLAAAAVGAAVGALVSHAASEQDRQAADYHRKVANDLTTKYSNLEKTYHNHADKSKKQIRHLTQKHCLDEADISPRTVRNAFLSIEKGIVVTAPTTAPFGAA